MKMRNLILGLVLSTAIFFAGCNKKDDENSNPSGAGSMSLKHNGTDWSASLAVVGVNSNGVVNITGSDSNAGQGSVIIYQPNGPGTYNVGPGGNPGNILRWTQGLGQEDSFMANNVIGSGEVTFTELSATKAVGTFKFTGFNTAQNSKQITEGEFNVTF